MCIGLCHLQVKRDFICLYCNDRRQPFQSLEAVRKHMEAKGHCKLRFGDGGDDEDADLQNFYDYSSRFLSSLLNFTKFLLTKDQGHVHPNHIHLLLHGWIPITKIYSLSVK
jgi:hypothetical protein